MSSISALESRSASYDEDHSIVSIVNATPEVVQMFETVGSYMSGFVEKHKKNGKNDYAALRDCYVKSRLFNLVEEKKTLQRQQKCDISILPNAVAGMIDDCDGRFQDKVTKSVTKLVDTFRVQEGQMESVETNVRKDSLKIFKYRVVGENIYELEMNYFDIECRSINNIGFFENWNCTDYEVHAKKALFYLNSVVYKKNKEGLENNVPLLDFN